MLSVTGEILVDLVDSGDLLYARLQQRHNADHAS